MGASGDVFDVAHAQETALRDLSDNALLAEVRLADLEMQVARERHDDLQTKIAGITEKRGPTGVPDALSIEERNGLQAVRMAQLRLMMAQDEQRRRREWVEQEAAQQAALERAQRLAALRDTAWQQFQADMGRTIDGVSLADRSAFDDRWGAFLADLAIGRAELPGS